MPHFVASGYTSLRALPAPRHLPSMGHWLIYHGGVRRRPRVRALAAFLVELFKSQQPMPAAAAMLKSKEESRRPPKRSR